jgi:hypothetical protein
MESERGGAALGEGTYTAQAEQSDEAGNTGKSATSTFTVDTTAPAVTLTPVASPTNDTTPSFSGGAGDASRSTSQSVTLKIYSGSSASGSPIQTISVTPTGATWKASVAAALGEGTYTAQAEQSDKAGNIGKSATSTFAIYHDAPGGHADPRRLTDKQPEAELQRERRRRLHRHRIGDAQDLLRLKRVGQSRPHGLGHAHGTTWKASVAETLGEGTYTAQAEQSDEAGNVGKSATSTFIVDTTPRR